MQEQENRLQQEILQDARRKAERALERARRDADALAKAVQTRAAEARETALAKAREEGASRARAVTAGIRHQVQREWLGRREAVLAEALQRALTEVEHGSEVDPVRSLGALLREAVAALGTREGLIVRVRPADEGRLRDAVLPALALPAGTVRSWTVVADPDLGGGLVVETADGRRRCDQTYAARLARLRAELRQAIARAAGVAELDVDAVIKESTSDVG